MPCVDPETLATIHGPRRARIGQAMGQGVLVLYGGALRTRSNDTHFRFRPDSDFHYLTGLAEPGAVAVLRGGSDPELTLFVRPRDPAAEVWSGRRVGPDGATAHYGADKAYSLSELDTELPKLLDGAAEVHWPVGRWRPLDQAITAALDHLRRRNRTGETAPELLRDARGVLGEDRIIKDAPALTALRRAVEITASAHRAAMAATGPGLHEFTLEALIEFEFRRHGSGGPGYGTIVGAGDNATILHYVDNCDPLGEGELVLVDAGAEVDLFTADITRTWPVSGRFSPAQRDLYDVVLAANEAGIACATVGGTIDGIHQRCVQILCEGLCQLGLLKEPPAQAVEQETYKRYYMHRSSHWLGADVHDAGDYTRNRSPRPLVPGFVLTVEPGLYIAKDDDQAPPEFRGIGIRIEDDVLVREQGPEVLTWSVPKRRDELEALVGSAVPQSTGEQA